MKHSQAQLRALSAMIFFVMVLLCERAFANPVMVPALTTYNGSFSLPATGLALVVEYFFLKRIPGFTKMRAASAVLLMNLASAIPGLFFSFVLNSELFVFLHHRLRPLWLGQVPKFDPWYFGPDLYLSFLVPIMTFPLMLALDVLIEGAVLAKVFKMKWSRKNLLILTAANAISLLILYIAMMLNVNFPFFLFR